MSHSEDPAVKAHRRMEQSAERYSIQQDSITLGGSIEWAVFRASDGENGSPVENLRYSTRAGAQESIDTGYNTPDFWEPRWRDVGEWKK